MMVSDKVRDQFKDWCGGHYRLDTKTDSAGETVYVDRWVQGAWIGYRAAMRTTPEGWVMVHKDAFKAIHNAAAAESEQSINRKWSEWFRDRAAGRAQGLRQAVAILTTTQKDARP